MDYDFTSIVDRSGVGSLKWDEMKRKNPDVAPDILPFSIADMELKTPPEVVRGLQDFLDNTILGYTDPTAEYYAAVRGWLRRRHGWEVQTEWIVGSDGVVPAFHTAVKAFTEPGDGVLLMTPAYYPFFRSIHNNGRRLVAMDLLLADGKYRIDFDLLEHNAKDPRNKLLLFCSPHNPVGRVWSEAELERVGRICIDNGVLVLADEIHFDLVMKGYRHTVFGAISDEFARHCIVCTAPSKTFNLAGMAVSNIVIPDESIRKRYLAEEATTGRERQNILGYKACELAYTRCEAWLEGLLELISINDATVRTFMAEHFPEVKVHDLEGTYLLWLDFRAWGMTAPELERFMVFEAQLFLDEGYVFGPCGSGFERINLACPTHALVTALRRLRTAYEKFRKKEEEGA